MTSPPIPQSLLHEERRSEIRETRLEYPVPSWALDASQELCFSKLAFSARIGIRPAFIEQQFNTSVPSCIIDSFLSPDDPISAIQAMQALDWAFSGGANLGFFDRGTEKRGPGLSQLFQCLKKTDGTLIADALARAGFKIGNKIEWGSEQSKENGSFLSALTYYSESFHGSTLAHACRWAILHNSAWLNERDSMGLAPLGSLNEALRRGHQPALEAAKVLLELGADPQSICLRPESQAVGELSAIITCHVEKRVLNQVLCLDEHQPDTPPESGLKSLSL